MRPRTGSSELFSRTASLRGNFVDAATTCGDAASFGQPGGSGLLHTHLMVMGFKDSPSQCSGT